MIEVWASVDAENALTFVRSLPPSFFKPGIAEQALAILARSDATKALEWVPRLVSGKHQPGNYDTTTDVFPAPAWPTSKTFRMSFAP